MDRLARVARLWAWLPAFRAVAETEHLRQAADALHVSASALSRTVGLVEADLEISLFHRVGRRIALTEAGAILLAATRDAMRTIHNALEQIESDELHGDLRVSAPSTITRMFLLSAIATLRQKHPKLCPRLGNRPTPELGDLLLRGELDVAFTNAPIASPALTSVLLGHYTSSLYCGLGHPLRTHAGPTLADVTEHPFVAPPPDSRGHPREGWPVDVARRIDIEVSDLHIGLELCRQGSHLAVFPDPMVAAHVARGELCPIALGDGLMAPTPFFATHRIPVGRPSAAERLTELVRNEAAAR